MQTFQNRIASYIGEGISGDLALTTAMLDDWLTQGARDILNRLPFSELWIASTDSNITSSSGVAVGTNRILSVVRSDGDRKYPCRYIPKVMFDSIDNINDINAPMKHDPVYTLDNGYVKIKPVPTSSEPGTVTYLSYPSVDSTGTTVSGFPDDYIDLIVQYTVAHIKIREAGYMRRKAQDEVEAAVTALSSFQSNLPSKTDFDSITLSTDFTNVTDALTKAQTLIDSGASIGGDAAATGMSVQSRLSDDDAEMVSATISAAQQELSRANAEINKVRTYIEQYSNEMQGANIEFAGKLSLAGAYLQEAGVRINTASQYMAQSASAGNEAAELFKKYESDLKAIGVTK